MFSLKIIVLGSLSFPRLDSSSSSAAAMVAAMYIVKPTYPNSIIPTSLPYSAFSWRPEGAAGGPNRKLEGWLHPPIVPHRSWPSSMKVFNLLFIMPVKDAPSPFSPPFVIPLALRAFAVGLALSCAPVCASVCWVGGGSPCTHACIRAHTHTHGRMHVFALVGVYGPYLYARVRVREYVARH